MFIENTEELAQSKLLLLYLIKSAASAFTNSEITEFVLEKNYMNFFLVQQYLSELVESKFIETIKENSKDVYFILEKGEIALSYFEERIPNKIKQELNDEFKEENKKTIVETQVVSEFFEKENNQFVVNLKLVENDETLFSLYVDVATKMQVDLICSRWEKDTESIYQNIINLLTNEKTTPLE